METDLGSSLEHKTDYEGITASDSGPQSLPISELADRVLQSSESIRQELAGKHPVDFTAEDQGFSDLIDSPAAYGLLRTLDQHGIDALDVNLSAAHTPRDVMRDIMVTGQDTLREHGIASPDMSLYNEAADMAHATGHPLEQVIAEFEARAPLAVDKNLNLPDSFSLGEDSNTVTTDLSGPALASAAPQAGEKSLGDDFEAIDYKDYDVHLMAYPIPATQNLASHAFVVVVEKGTAIDADSLREAIIEDGKGFITRGGPDGKLFIPGSTSASPSESSQSSDSSKSSDSSDSSVEASGSSSEADDEGRKPEGDVYISDSDISLDDLRKEGVYKIQSSTIHGNLAELEAEVLDFRDTINDADINYYATHQNSNTYAGDVYEKLTGQEPVNGEWRLTPGLKNDLMDYEETDYANDFF